MHGPTRGPSQDSAMVLFTKVYRELNSRIPTKFADMQ